MAIAAARLGLHCITIGHVGDEIYGRFLIDVLSDEGISIVGMNEQSEVLNLPSSDYETLLCWVLVDPLQRHGFCRSFSSCFSQFSFPLLLFVPPPIWGVFACSVSGPLDVPQSSLTFKMFNVFQSCRF